MKKQLLATTALVAVGLVGATGTANANMKLGIGGFQEIIVGVADQDDAVRNSTDYDTQFDGEIHFKASQTLDNGLKLRTRVELESKTESDQIDEAYIDVSGKWGAIRVGSEDNAAHLMVTPTMGSWATNVGQNTNFDVTDWIILPKDHQGKVTSRLELGEGDAEKITYFSPRVGGVQVGVSYMPSGEEDKNSSIAPTDVDIVHGWAAATNYRGKFGGTSIGLAAGYAQAKQPSGQSGGKVAGFFPEGDPKGWSVSGKVSFAGVTLAAGYMNRMNLGSGDGISTGGNALDLGAKYDFGKNHIGVGYVYNEAEASYAISGDDESTRLMASYRRDLGKGIQYRLNFIYGNFEGEAAGNADDNEGVAVTTGVRIAF